MNHRPAKPLPDGILLLATAGGIGLILSLPLLLGFPTNPFATALASAGATFVMFYGLKRSQRRPADNE